MAYIASCLCGAVSLTIEGEVRHVMHCHCSMCRKAHGSAFASYGLVEKDKVRVEGEEYIQSFQSSKNTVRTFCRLCGSNIEWKDKSEFNEKYRSFSLGLLDSEFTPSSEEHIFESSTPNWCPTSKNK
ncbi:GFA family protein [Vibrio sonorensis]|uniref:GFA family protein n=1 Tax=Vibrio sonorensis TaxID=1004316 RepID=UPI0009FF1402|nr:GFA family protein [Vibrio sonorensis]